MPMDDAPSIDTIERELFGPAEELIARWAEGDPSLAETTVRALEHNRWAREERDRWGDNLSLVESTTGVVRETAKMSAHLENLIQRRVAARNSFASNTGGAPGRIVLVEHAEGPDAPPAGRLRCPLAVALSAECPGEADVWEGWIVVPQDHIAYVTCWDMLLEEEKDGPFDPNVAVVQLWNPVRVHVARDAVTVGRLSAVTLAAARAISEEFAQGLPPDLGPPRPGWFGVRPVGGHSVVTGTRLGGRRDPRRAYQRLYSRAAAMVSLPAPMLAGDARLGAMMSRISRGLEQWAADMGIALTRTAPIAQPMGAHEEERIYRLGDQMQLRLCLHGEGQVVHLHAAAAGQEALDLALRQGDELMQSARLDREHRSADFFFEVAKDYVLAVEAHDSGARYQIPLT